MLAFLLLAALPTFHVTHLPIEGEAADVASADFDGDGAPDLLVASVTQKKGDARRLFTIFWNDNGAFTAHLAVPAPSQLAMFDVGDLGAGGQLFALGHDGVRALSLKGRKPGEWRQVVTQPTLFARSPRKQLERWRAVQNIAGPRLLVPDTNALTIYDNTFAKRGAVGLDLDASCEKEERTRDPKDSTQPSASFNLLMPAIHVLDMNADGRADIAIVQGERLTAFAQSPAGDFTATPIIEHRFPVRGADDDARVSLTLVDVDGDGRGDIVATKLTSTGITSATTTVTYFHASADGFGHRPG